MPADGCRGRRAMLRAVSQALGRRRLVWFGTRGDDVEAAADIPQLEASFSLIAAYAGRSSVEGLSLENITGERVDLDTYDIDDHLRTAAVGELRAALLRALSAPSALFAYRPTTFLSAVAFARQDRCRYLGLFKGHQDGFEHKPWVESSLADSGVPRIPWTYVADVEQLYALRLLRDGPVMLRRSRTTGGVGLTRVEAPEELGGLWPDEDEAYVSVAPFIEGGIPLNVGAVVWRDGITVHPASVQLIGIRECTRREFGYCGNDFGAAGDLGRSTLDAVERSVRAIGAWLRGYGYRGAFGLDFLVKDGVPLFTEINPRFQGSTHASTQLSVERDESCLLLEHLAAHLGFDAPKGPSLSDLVPDAPGFAHFVVHHLGTVGARIDPVAIEMSMRAVPRFCRLDVATSPTWNTQPGATVARLTVRDRLTHGGFDLLDPWRGLAAAALSDVSDERTTYDGARVSGDPRGDRALC